MSNLAKFFLPVVGVVGLAGGVYYFSQHKGSLGSHTVADLARSTPQKAFLWVAAEMRDELSAEKLTSQIEKARKDFKGFQEFAEGFEKDTHKKLEEAVKIYAASGYLALYTLGGKDYLEETPGSQSPLDLLLDCQLYDPKAADEMLAKVKEKAKLETVAGQSVYLVDKDFCLCIAGDSLLIASNKSMMERAINATLQHKNTLSEDEKFKQAMAKVPNLTKGNGSTAFLDLNTLWNTIEKLPRVAQYTDADTFKGLRSLPYLVGGVYTQSGTWHGEGFVAVDTQSKTDLAAAFLKKPTPSHGLAALVPESWGSYQGFDTIYTYELLQALVRLVPMGRMGLTMGMAQVGMGQEGAREKLIRKAFDGQTAWSVDMNALSKAGAESAGGASSQGQRTACSSNLKNVATALEMYSTDNAGRYPETLAPLAPNYLKTIPTCPSSHKDTYSETYKVGADPDSYSFRCSDTQAHDLAYTSEKGLIAEAPLASATASSPGADQVQGALLFGVKDAAAARELLNQVGAWEKIDIGGKDAYHMSQDGAELYWMLLDKPSALVVGFAAKGKESLAAVTDCASGKTASLAKRPAYSSFAGKYSKDSVEFSYLNLKALLQQLKEAAAKSTDPDQAMMQQLLTSVEAQLSDDLGSIQVEADGLRFTNEGTAGVFGMGAASLMAIAGPNFMKARGQGQLTACKSNEKNIATALEMYSTDNAGRYPETVKKLSPDYLKVIPTCPAASKDTYSETYQVTVQPDLYSFFCAGHNHGDNAAEGYPQYNAQSGLVERP